ncbi:hypothetical protein EA473_07420 [Natrarchaeobius chitinivorans]|uniref:Uncharacterized protein n=1 Tax=Natrarchaeobius chitinivorans TaxID=1679083 RepID=A0A3N6LYS4_NATCH|nr:hypothetical protein EA473_07420 [Natrarchaeobius chitinivorans]
MVDRVKSEESRQKISPRPSVLTIDTDSSQELSLERTAKWALIERFTVSDLRPGPPTGRDRR